MQTAHTVEEVRELVSKWKQQGLRIGFTPTMGYLHEGHESLMRAAVADADKLVVSIFVNPMQFGPGEDFERYPRDTEHDLAVCLRNKADLVFFPSVESMYPPGFHTSVEVESLTERLCGKSRPGHFKGVCTVVCKLFNIVSPDFAYFGQKDAQQLAVIRRMTADLNMPITIVGCPIVREADGLAKSSRNAYLNAEERRAALALSRSLALAEQAVRKGERQSAVIRDMLQAGLAGEALVRPDYIEIVDAGTLQPIERLEGEVLLALAAYVGKTRLIDNSLLTVSAAY